MRRPSVAELERAAARYGSIHERWNKQDFDRPQIAGQHPTPTAVARASDSEPAPKSRESFPPPSEPPFRPPFDTLIGVPRNSFAPADPQKALRASTDALAAPIDLVEVHPHPRRSRRGLMAAAVVLVGASAAAVHFGAVDRVRVLLTKFDLLPASLSSERTAQSVESLRASAEPSSPALPALQVVAAPEANDLDDGNDDDIAAPPIAAASRQSSDADSAASHDEKVAPERTVPRSDTSRRVAAPAKSAPSPKRTVSKRATKPTRNPASEETPSKQTLPRAAQATSAKDSRRAKPRAPRQKPSRKTEQTGIIRQSPF